MFKKSLRLFLMFPFCLASFLLTPSFLRGADASPISSVASVFYSQFDFYQFHSRSLFARSGELRENFLNNGVWLNEGFGFLQYRELEYFAKLQTSYNHISLGVDTSFALPKATLYFGGELGFINANTRSALFNGRKESYALGAYFSYLRQNRFFVDVNAKYFYKTQTIFFSNAPLNDALYGDGNSGMHFGVNIGQKFGTSSGLGANTFFLEPSLMLETGYIPEQNFSLESGIKGGMQGFFPFSIRFNLAFGKEWNARYKGALKGGISLEYDAQVSGAMSLQDANTPFIYLKDFDDFRVGVFLEADFILNQNFRFFVRSKSTISGKIDTIYAMNLGVRMSFGPWIKHGLHYQKTIDWTDERLQ